MSMADFREASFLATRAPERSNIDVVELSASLLVEAVAFVPKVALGVEKDVPNSE